MRHPAAGDAEGRARYDIYTLLVEEITKCMVCDNRRSRSKNFTTKVASPPVTPFAKGYEYPDFSKDRNLTGRA
ncbi:hypothetical protein [Sneathiella sp. HT1-7]|uniref:hypothetical protein n=1 Tax=Sneathiella sp. HT1-7 TaxID=2887192 RepID=UPI001D140081|nr:hypothetical protein [Sneathiella sp. HT1-7]MCC3304782.1 hypothetical protein [Sneathiella sp. HT1-7]